MGNRVSTLPQSKISKLPLLLDILVEILLLLPLDSIHACRLVSKEWKNLIDDSNFIKLYKGESTILFLDKGRLRYVKKYTDYFHQKKKYTDYYRLRPVLKQIDIYPNGDLLVDSSNKIACVKTSNEQFLLYNLFTGDLRVVADAPVQRHLFPIWWSYGFGYDPYDDDYKIVVVCKGKLRYLIPFIEETRFDLPRNVSEEDAKRSLIFVYSYKNNCWKFTDGFRDDEYSWSVFRVRGFSFNGVLHWIVTKAGVSTERIVGLHLNSYVLAEFELPPPYYNDNHMRPYTNLTTFDGRLCCFLDRVVLDVWVMEEYGVAKTWTKLFRICRSMINDTSFHWFEFRDMRVYRDRESGKLVVFMHNQYKFELYHYDMNNDKIKVFSRIPRRKRDYSVPGLQSLLKGCCLRIQE